MISIREWQDLESSTRVKERKVIVERRKTGGGVSKAEPLTQLEEMIAENLSPAVISGIELASGSQDMIF